MASSAALSSSSYSTTNTNTNNLGAADDDSFATYLSLISQSFSADLVLSRPPSTNHPNPACRSSSLSAFTQKRSDDGELDVFTAEKYFSGTLDTTTAADSTALSDHPNISKNPQINKTTTTTRSTNSRTVLLRGGSHQQHQNDRSGRRRRRSTFLDVFRCVCLKKKDADAADVDDENEEINAGRKWRRRRSESSSELFEIESSLSGTNSAVAARGGYAPSEASISWSVVTASAANMSTISASGRRVQDGNGSEEDGILSKKRRSSASALGMLTMGCASEKAASVVRGEVKVVGSLERYRAIMDFESATNAGEAPTSRPRRVSLG